MERQMTIGDLARATGVAARTIRYYESAELLPQPARTPAGYRTYTTEDARRLGIIRRARDLGMPLVEARRLNQSAESARCGDFRLDFARAVDRRLAEVGQHIQDLLALQARLRIVAKELQRRLDEESDQETMLACSPETCTCMG